MKESNGHSVLQVQSITNDGLIVNNAEKIFLVSQRAAEQLDVHYKSRAILSNNI